MKYIFKTKFAKDFDKNGMEIEILKDLGHNMYLIRFIKTGETLKVYDNEIEESE